MKQRPPFQENRETHNFMGVPPKLHRRFKKFDPHLKDKVKEEAQKLASQPYACEGLKGPLSGIRSWHFDFQKTQYRIAFRIIKHEKQIEIVLVNNRENFYQVLKKIIKTR